MRAFRRWGVRASLLGALSFQALLLPPELHARPGGGQAFKSSGSSSKSSGSKSSGSSSKSSGSSRSSTSSGSSRSSTSSGSSRSSTSSGSTNTTRSSSGSTGTGVWVGSGHSSSGSSSSHDDDDTGSSSGGGTSKLLLFALVVLAAAVIFYFVFIRSSGFSEPDWSSGTGGGPDEPDIEPAPPTPDPAIARGFAQLLAADPGFSRALLEDFLYALYAEVQRQRGGGHLDRMEAYLDPTAILTYQREAAVAEVRDVIVGAVAFEEVRLQPMVQGRVSVVVRFVANYTEVNPGGETAWFVEERWTLSRNPSTPSRKPDNARVIGCPNCGAPLDKVLQGTCTYCKARVVGEQELDWRVESIEILAREPRGPMLTGTVEEEGTETPTILDPQLEERTAALMARDPQFSWDSFHERLKLVFQTFHQAWTAQDLAPVRPFLSDNLFETQTYWIETYKKQGLRNVSADPTLMLQQVCKVDTDGYYDLITVRIRACNHDYTVDASGTVVGGNKDKVRVYSEYWTFLRGKEAHGAPKADRSCPNCGAPTEQINMSGRCGSCGVKVTSGSFDWVLSRIEQDEVYTG